MFYYVYGSKSNKEPSDKLMWGMTLPEFLDHKEYIDVQNSLEYAITKDNEPKPSKKGK